MRLTRGNATRGFIVRSARNVRTRMPAVSDVPEIGNSAGTVLGTYRAKSHREILSRVTSYCWNIVHYGRHRRSQLSLKNNSRVARVSRHGHAGLKISSAKRQSRKSPPHTGAYYIFSARPIRSRQTNRTNTSRPIRFSPYSVYFVDNTIFKLSFIFPFDAFPFVY